MSRFLASRKIIVAVIGLPLLGTAGYLVKNEEQALPREYIRPVPFSVQAPTGNWENNEDCEETSALMVHQALTGDTRESLPPEEVGPELQKLNQWEDENLGHSANASLSDIERMLQANFGLHTQMIESFTEKSLQQELAQGHLVIMSINLKELENARYEGAPEQEYHVFVVHGYDQDGFIVNDPGTASGKDNHYPFSTIEKAAAGWDSQTKQLIPQYQKFLSVSR